MAKVALTQAQKRLKEREMLSVRTEQELLKNKIKKKDLAALAGITERTLFEMFRRKNISLDVLVAANMLIAEKTNLEKEI